MLRSLLLLTVMRNKLLDILDLCLREICYWWYFFTSFARQNYCVPSLKVSCAVKLKEWILMFQKCFQKFSIFDLIGTFELKFMSLFALQYLVDCQLCLVNCVVDNDFSSFYLSYYTFLKDSKYRLSQKTSFIINLIDSSLY